MYERENGSYQPIEVLIAEPRRLVRDAYKSLIESTNRFTVVGDTGKMNTTLTLTEKLQPNLILLDVHLAIPTLKNTIQNLRDKAPSSKTLLVATSEWISDATALVNQGDVGVVLTESTGAELLMGLNELNDHGFYLATGVTRRLFIRNNQDQEGFNPRIRLLTGRQRELLHLISNGRPNREIATELSISVRTVEAHKARMIARLGLHNTTELLRYAVYTAQDS